ncbi:MAG: DNA mismatch repair protein MutS, partial [Holosporaceae bacterium]|nr:DNA mismatch repair protein MutS [Holosporaceae bacterium]
MEEDSLFYSAIKDATPAMSRYFEIKSQYPGCLLLFRIGDFYEMFFDDAKVASSILNIALTHRGKHGNEDIPMCGIPVATLDNYLGKLVRYGQKIAVCDQMENPEEAKKRGHKAVIKREVTRIITAGTLLEDVLLNAEKNNYLMAIVPSICKKTSAVKTISFSAIDISTGDFFVNSVVKEEFPNIINVYAPKEVLVPSRHENDEFGKYVAAVCEIHITFLPDSKFNPIVERERLERYFKVDTLDSFGITMNEELAACGAVLEYLLITQRGHLSSLPIPKRTSMGAYLILDPSTSKSLEITVSCRGEYQPSLLGSIDQTVTPLGARNLAARISTPIVDRDLLEKRLDCVEFFVENRKAANLLREIIRNCPDFERALNRVRFNKFSPRDIGDIRECLRIVEHLKSVLKDVAIPSEGEYLWENLRDFSSLLELLETALADKLPAGGRTGCLIADGYSKELDQLKYMKDHSEELIADLRNKYVDETDVGTLRIKNNGILGWYIEIPISQKSKMLGRFIHRQTLQNAVRYTSVELMSLQAKFTEALEQWNQLEQKIYGDVVRKLTSYHDDFVYAAKLLANLDVYTNFAHIAVERNYVRPVISPDPILEIEEGRHPVLELQEKEFTPNDCHLTMEERICLLTGPNM